MILAVSAMISEIDAFSHRELGIPLSELLDRSGEAVARAVRAEVKPGSSVAVLAGKGNNGADGYSAAAKLLGEYRVTVYDVFGEPMRSEEGRRCREQYVAAGGEVVCFAPTPDHLSAIKGSDCILDAIFGTGYKKDKIPDPLHTLAITVREAVDAHKIAVDVPLGIDPDDGTVTDYAVSVGTTVALCFIKPGIVSYPARAYVGRIVYDDLGLPRDAIREKFHFSYHLTDDGYACAHLPLRPENSHKGTFGKLLLMTGSEKYRGAALLSAESALRGGVGYVTYAGPPALVSALSARFPEMIYEYCSPSASAIDERILALSAAADATLIGCGSDSTPLLGENVRELLATPGGVLVLDADAINSLVDSDREAGCAAIRNAARPVILTPHPMEFSRLTGIPVAQIQLHRIEAAKHFAEQMGCVLALKGASTLVTDGTTVLINSTGTSALAKAGSGDVLAGLVAAFAAQHIPPLDAAALAVFFHGYAGDALAREFSSFGVTPSDLPAAIARAIARIQKMQQDAHG